MSIQKLAIGSVVATIVLYALGYVLWEILFLDYFTANAGAAGAGLREDQVLWAALLGTLGYGALVTRTVGAQAGVPTIVAGVKMGALAGFLLWFSADLMIYGFLDLWNLTATVLDIGLETARAAVSGAVVALVLARLPD